MQALIGRSDNPPTTVACAAAVPEAAPWSASSATMTVQAPQSPSAQPSLVPVHAASSRNHSSTLRVGGSAFHLGDAAAVHEADGSGVHGVLGNLMSAEH